MTMSVKTISTMEEIPERCGALCLKRNDASFHVTILVLSKTKTDIESQENIAVLKRAMSQKHVGWSSKDWNSKSNWQRSAVEDAGQSSQDKRKNSKPRAKWKEISRTLEELGTLVKDKTSTWIKSCKESSKRETEIRLVGRYG